MSPIQTFADLIAIWPNAAVLAADLKVKEVTARAWRRRGIPSEYWKGLVAAAEARGFTDVTLDLLADIAAVQAGRGPEPAEAGRTRQAAE